MASSGSRGFRTALAGSGALIGVGAASIIAGQSLPIYSVPYDQAADAFVKWCNAGGSVDDAAGERYMAMFGWHYALTMSACSWGRLA